MGSLISLLTDRGVDSRQDVFLDFESKHALWTSDSQFFVIGNKFVLIVDNNDNVVSDSSVLFACLLCSCSCEVEYLLFYQWQGLVWATRIIDIEMQLCNKSVQFPCDDKRKIQDYGLRSFGNH